MWLRTGLSLLRCGFRRMLLGPGFKGLRCVGAGEVR